MVLASPLPVTPVLATTAISPLAAMSMRIGAQAGRDLALGGLDLAAVDRKQEYAVVALAGDERGLAIRREDDRAGTGFLAADLDLAGRASASSR